MSYWLFKSEPNAYSINDLQRERVTIWDGVRNYQARNFLRQMNPGDFIFFYHSNTTSPGIVGLARTVQNNLVDPTQFDINSPYFDPKATLESPRWQTVKIEFVETFEKLLSLSTLKEEFSAEELLLVRKGNRLSVMPVAEAVGLRILALSRSRTETAHFL